MKPGFLRKRWLGLQSIALMLGVFGLIAALCGWLYHRETGHIQLRLSDREVVRVATEGQLFHANLQSVANTLRILADGDGLRNYLKTGGPAEIERINRRAIFVSQQEPNYDQVRYLNEKGLEVVRANHGGVLVPPDRLQNKSDRNYFMQAQGLAAGQIFISAFDLNVENGRIEVPFKPMLRFSTPVFDAEGRRRGVYVINYLGDALLDQLQSTDTALQRRLRVLNAQGYWIKADSPADEWGFMLPDRAGFTLAKTAPELWARVSREKEGQTLWAGGLFTWRRLEPKDFGLGDEQGVVAENGFLVVASEVSAADWNQLIAGLRQAFIIVALGLMLLAGSSAWFLHNQRRAVGALRRSEENLAVTLNSIGDGVLATDTAGNVTRMNRVAEQLTGWPLAEANGRDVREIFRIIHENTREPAVLPVQDVLATGKIHGLSNHTVLISRDGSERAIADSAAPIRNRRGAVVGVVLAFRDVSEERAAEQKMQSARRELDRFFALSLDFLCISSADGYFKRVSPAVTDMLGWTPEEFMALPYIELVHPDDVPATLREVDDQMCTGKTVFHFENRYRHKNGSWRVLSWRSVPQPDGLMYATARDVTDRNRIEEQINQLNRDLNHRAAQLEDANKELESFSYSVSHDLRAPLRHVQGYVEMLSNEMGDKLSEKSRRYLKTIATSGLEMGQLIDNLLSFSRMGRSAMAEMTVDLGLLFEEARVALELTTRDRAIRWAVAALPKVRGDPAMLKQVVANLVDNAVKYSRQRNPAVITIGSAGAEDGRIIFFVRDNGAGFDMKYADKLFGVFQRLHRVDEFEGTGIGLANVRRIILRHGGRTWAEGAVDAGATFYFTLKPALEKPSGSIPPPIL